MVLALQIEGLCNKDRVHYYNKAYNMMQEVSIDYVVGSHRKREDNSMMIFMDRTGQEDEERTLAVMMDDLRWDEDQDESTMEPLTRPRGALGHGTLRWTCTGKQAGRALRSQGHPHARVM